MTRHSLRNEHSRHVWGVTLLEVLASLAVGASLSMMMIQLLGNLSEDQMAVGLRRHHQLLADAAQFYIEKNHLALKDQFDTTGQTELRLPLVTYQANSGLPVGWRDTNPMGQTSCLIVYQEAVNNQNVMKGLLITQGGRDMALNVLWPAAMVQTHGVGILERDATTNRVRAIGYRGQWEVRQAVDGGPLSGVDCTGTPLAIGHLATLLNLRNPSEITANQTIMRKNANSNALTTIDGGLSLPDPTQGQTLQVAGTASQTAGYACVQSDEGKLAPNANGSGQLLLCQQVSTNAWQWSNPPTGQPAVSSTINTATADQLLIDGIVTENSSCARLGELARVSDGALAYCSRAKSTDAPSTWTWHKVGGKWKYVLTNQSRTTITLEPWATTFSMSSLGVPATARVAQVSVFAQSNNPPLSIKMNGVTVAKTCCKRDLGVSLLVPNAAGKFYFVDEDPNAMISALWIQSQGYIDDDPAP